MDMDSFSEWLTGLKHGRHDQSSHGKRGGSASNIRNLWRQVSEGGSHPNVKQYSSKKLAIDVARRRPRDVKGGTALLKGNNNKYWITSGNLAGILKKDYGLQEVKYWRE